MKVFVGICVLLCVLGASVANACTLAWTAPTKYTDGTNIVGVIKYKVFFQPLGSSTAQMISEVTTTSVTILCPAGQYWVTAVQDTALESAKSNILDLKQVNPPVNLTWTN